MRILVLFLLVGFASPASAFFVGVDDVSKAARWSAEEFAGTGLHDGLQVAVADDFEEILGATPDEIPILRQIIRDAFSAWETPVLRFEIEFDVPRVPNTREKLVRGEIQLFADAENIGSAGGANGVVAYHLKRLLTNGQRIPGPVIIREWITFSEPVLRSLRELLALSEEEERAALQRLIMHEIGHSLGLEHSNANPYRNLDTDEDPDNSMQLDPCDPGSTLSVSPNLPRETIMTNPPPTMRATLLTELQPDDAGGRDALYPFLAPGDRCPAPAVTELTAGLQVLLDGSGDGNGHTFQRSNAMDIDSHGNLYVADPSSVFKIEPNGKVSHIATTDDHLIYAIKADDHGNVFAIGQLPQGLRISPDGTQAPIHPDLAGAQFLDIDASGNLWISRSTGLFKWSPDGSLAQVDVPIDRPFDVRVDRWDNVYVAGFASHNVIRIEPDGTIREVVDPAAGLRKPTAFSEDPDGNVYISGVESLNVFRISPDGRAELALDLSDTPVETFGRMRFDSERNLFLPTNLGILKIEPETAKMIKELDPLGTPQSIEIDPTGRLIVSYGQGLIVGVCVSGFDLDCDLVGDEIDNCPSTPNTDQADADGDGVGNVCDNCIEVHNGAQTDSDGDEYGNECDLADYLRVEMKQAKQAWKHKFKETRAKWDAKIKRYRKLGRRAAYQRAKAAKAKAMQELKRKRGEKLQRLRERIEEPPGPSAFAPICGNGVVEDAVGESCDDGNLIAGDGCSGGCRLEP